MYWTEQVEEQHVKAIARLKVEQEAAKRQHVKFMENAATEFQRLQAESQHAQHAVKTKHREEIASEKERLEAENEDIVNDLEKELAAQVRPEPVLAIHLVLSRACLGKIHLIICFVRTLHTQVVSSEN